MSCFNSTSSWVSSVYLVLFVSFCCAEVTNFIRVVYYENGQSETLISYKGFSAKEISVSNKNQSGLSLRQISDGKRFLQLIFDEESLKDCQYLLHKDQIQTFLNSFNNTDVNVDATSKIFVENLHNRKKLPHHFKKWFNFTKMKKLCREKHKEIRGEVTKLEEYQLEEIELEKTYGRLDRHKRSLFEVLLPGTNWCGDRNRAKSYTDLNLFWKTDKCCRKHDFCQMDIPGFTFRYAHFNQKPFTISFCKCDDRFPGTRWCGKGYSVEKYTDLGMFSKTDRCCRQHDLACPFWIGAFQSKYGFHNTMINTLMHCSCDERFRACLKRVGTVDANLVGNIFFNYAQRDCFTLEPKKICKKNHKGKYRKRKDLNGRRTKRNEKKCKRKNAQRKAIIRRNLVY